MLVVIQMVLAAVIRHTRVCRRIEDVDYIYVAKRLITAMAAARPLVVGAFALCWDSSGFAMS